MLLTAPLLEQVTLAAIGLPVYICGLLVTLSVGEGPVPVSAINHVNVLLPAFGPEAILASPPPLVYCEYRPVVLLDIVTQKGWALFTANVPVKVNQK